MLYNEDDPQKELKDRIQLHTINKEKQRTHTFFKNLPKRSIITAVPCSTTIQHLQMNQYYTHHSILQIHTINKIIARIIHQKIPEPISQ